MNLGEPTQPSNGFTCCIGGPGIAIDYGEEQPPSIPSAASQRLAMWVARL